MDKNIIKETMLSLERPVGELPMSVSPETSSHAAGLLAANALFIEQVALHAGYQSRGSFTRTFRKHYGTDPSIYRSEAKRIFVGYQIEEDGAPSDWGHDKNNAQIYVTLDEL